MSLLEMQFSAHKQNLDDKIFLLKSALSKNTLS